MSIATIKALKIKYEQRHIKEIEQELNILNIEKSKILQDISDSTLSKLMEFIEKEFSPITWSTDYNGCTATREKVEIKFYLVRSENTKTIDSKIKALVEKREKIYQNLDNWEIEAYQAIASKQDIPKFEG